MGRAHVTPELLAWARLRRGLSVEEVSKKLNVKPAAILDWETGERQPTFRQAQQLAHAVHIPFGYLYLSGPPVEELPVSDFRIMPGEAPREPSPDLLDLLNDVLGKQQWFREYRRLEGIEELPFVGRYKPTDPEEEVASDIRDVIDVDGARERAPSWEAFLRELTQNAEQSGIMVMRSGVVGNNTSRPLDVHEFRGLSISDEVAPLIFINGRDFKGAQIFTFAHEMAHIWVGQGGVSNPDYGLSSERQDSAVEQFCNRVAAETLVPGRGLPVSMGAGRSPFGGQAKGLEQSLQGQRHGDSCARRTSTISCPWLRIAKPTAGLLNRQAASNPQASLVVIFTTP